jgi:hypothetical protein
MAEISEKDAILAWHVLGADKRLRFGDGRLVQVGKTLTWLGQPQLCVRGLHASPSIAHAAMYFLDFFWLTRVAVWGTVWRIEGFPNCADKIVGQYRKCIGMVRCTQVLTEVVERHSDGAWHNFASVAQIYPQETERVAFRLMGLTPTSRTRKRTSGKGAPDGDAAVH